MTGTIEWITEGGGEYWSKDERFHILKNWNRIRGNHWYLFDAVLCKNYEYDTLKECKSAAKRIVEKETKTNG